MTQRELRCAIRLGDRARAAREQSYRACDRLLGRLEAGAAVELGPLRPVVGRVVESTGEVKTIMGIFDASDDTGAGDQGEVICSRLE